LDTYYPQELRTVIHRIQAAVPNASVLIMSPMDKGERDSDGQIVTAAALPHIVEIQRQIARETGCAFFDTFEAMGGAGTMARWYTSQPRLVTADFIHPFPAGARKVGVLVDNAILAGYSRYHDHR
jgi:lysophospholipase L1-like esterase